ncbi:class I SAM-dependent methyltransferase [Fibrella forsythiae]|uniref:Methyltransferase domain-containing protein n=1 Tax=Fibrella forsythiae TaxID=2817061 RepID=A0ABS3JES8_9BACT|nr:class I SAM-dependent methyltransferase [Fibrella forsythiae]MBO0948491.1 methyltransferase domain-containing protein [Fibrella forsythiae]
MSTPKNTLTPQYFDDVYGANEDPWQFTTSPYERDKYAATVAALPKQLYDSGFEIGCSIGVLTHQLATRCRSLLSVDVSEVALRQARQRLAGSPQVRIENRMIPADFPDEPFDLIVVSEVGYYWSMNDLKKAQQQMIDHLQPGGQLLLVHWTPPVPDYPLTGDQVHETFLEKTGSGQPLRHLHGQREEKYRLDLFERV